VIPIIRLPTLALLLAGLFFSAACASSRAAARRRDRFPLDPREGLAGPFPDGVEAGWRALAAGDARLAEGEFTRARGARPYLAAEIGLIESWVLLGRTKEAARACGEALAAGEATVPLLVACGEARARSDQPLEAQELYARAAARDPGRPGLKARASELRSKSVETLVREAESRAKEGNFPDARGRIGRAIELSPHTAALHAMAAEIELAAGQRGKAFDRLREAYRLEPKNVAVQEKLAALALEQGDPALAVSVLDSLAARDERYRGRAAEARLAFRVSNWPAPEREAAESQRLTRAGAASLAWWMFPEIREARVASSAIASDIVSRRDSRAVTRAVALGLLDVDPETHRARPDAGLTRQAAARLLLRLLAIVKPAAAKPPCLEGAPGPVRSGVEAIRTAAACGLIGEEGGSRVGGPEFTKGLDRVRVLATGKGDSG